MGAKKFIVAIAALAPLALSAHWVNTVSGDGEKTDPGKYACALISNGSISTQIDNLGVQKQKKYVSFVPAVAWEGRRYGVPGDALIRFGYFDTKISVGGKEQKKAVKWTQSLNNKEAFTETSVEYPDATVKTIAFVPMAHDMLVVKKTVIPKSEARVDLDFIYTFDNFSKSKGTDRVFIKNKSTEPNCALFEYRAIGHRDYTGIVAVRSDAQSSPSFDAEKVARLSSSAKASPSSPLEISYIITFADNFDRNHKTAHEKLTKAAQKGFDELFAEHKAGWAKYWQGSHINIPDKEIEKTYYTGLYHQRCNSTNWSLPVGVFADSHWNGRFFGWDEAFNAMALATSGKFEQSRKPSDFRQNTLERAIKRANKFDAKGYKRNCGCRFVWESLEDGHEGGPLGYWIEHIFHMSNMAMETWGHYLYTNDKKFLERNYELLVESSLYYIKNHVYEHGGSYTIGKCTDLERMGPAKENPFMTSCGVIYTLEKTAAAADVLGKDEDLAKEFRRIAAELRKTLPNDGEKYVPYPGSKDYSVGSVGGYYPYAAISETDPLGKKAVYDYYKNIDKGGNMYTVGKGVNAWYAGWMSSALVIFNDKENPAMLLASAAKDTGAFHDTFEINEPHNKVQYHPWFSTGSGNYVYAVSQMLLRPKENGEIMICSSVPDSWNDIDFSLPSFGGLWVNADIKNGKLVSISLEARGEGENGAKRTVVIPARFVEKEKILGKYTESDGYFRIEAEAGKKFYK